MKLGTKSHLISAYSALVTVAIGVLVWDFVRRGTAHDEKPFAAPKAAPAADAGAAIASLAAR